MEVCGGHTHAIYRFGLKDLLPPNIELIHGPGCPVCVLPMGRIDDGLAMAERGDVIFTAFGDMMRVPGAQGSPLEHKARGMDVRIVYSPADALKLAQANPEKHVMFFAIGFETTAPSTALTLMRAKALGVRNFSVFCNHVTIIPGDSRDPGFAGHAPGRLHRAGTRVHGNRLPPLRMDRAKRKKPIVVSGFEPLDMLQSIVMLLRQLRDGRGEGGESIQARGALGRKSRGAAGDGRSVRAAAVLRMARTGIHLAIGAADSRLVRASGTPSGDSEVPGVRVTDPKAAQCGEVFKGVLKPAQCKLFGNECTPEHPIGALMVSSEGSCAAYYKYEHRKAR